MLWTVVLFITFIWLVPRRKRDKFDAIKRTTSSPRPKTETTVIGNTELSPTFQQIPTWVVKDFIQSWHQHISTSGKFEELVAGKLQVILAAMVRKASSIDIVKAGLVVMPVLNHHVVQYKRAVRRLQTARLAHGGDDTLVSYFNQGKLHPAVSDPLPSLRTKVETHLLPLLPQPEQDLLTRLLFREIVVNKTLLPLIEHLSDPTFWNGLISGLTDQFHDPSRLERFAQVITSLDDDDKGEVTFDEFLKTIKECSDPIEANLVRTAILNEIRLKQTVLAGKDKNAVIDGIKASSIITYINRLQVARKRVEKRILKLGGTVDSQGTQQDLDDVLSDDAKCDVLYEFLDREGSGHLIVFYKLVEELRLRPSPSQLEEVLQFLDEQDPLPVSADVQSGLITLADTRASLDPLWQAQSQVYAYIQSILPYFDARSGIQKEIAVTEEPLVPGFFSISVQDSSTRKGTWYSIVIQRLDPAHHGQTLEIERSHQDLVFLHKSLLQAFPASMASIEFPNTTLVGELLKSRGKILESRRQSLEKYLKLCGRRNEIANSPLFLRFLSKDTNLSLPSLETTPLDPVANLFLDVFDLRADKNWLRRRALMILTQNLLGDMLEKKLLTALRAMPDRLEKGLVMLRDKLWPPPDRIFAIGPEPTLQERQDAASIASFKLDAFFSEMGNIVGRDNCTEASKLVFGMFQDQTINQHLLYTILDVLFREFQ